MLPTRRCFSLRGLHSKGSEIPLSGVRMMTNVVLVSNQSIGRSITKATQGLAFSLLSDLQQALTFWHAQR